MQNLQAPVIVLYQGSTTFYPIAVIHVHDTVDLFDLCVMYVTTDYTIKATFLTIGC